MDSSSSPESSRHSSEPEEDPSANNSEMYSTDGAPVTLPREDVLLLTSLSDRFTGVSSSSLYPQTTTLVTEESTRNTNTNRDPPAPSSPKSSRRKKSAGKHPKESEKIKKAVKKEKKSVDAVVAAAIRNYVGDKEGIDSGVDVNADESSSSSDEDKRRDAHSVWAKNTQNKNKSRKSRNGSSSSSLSVLSLSTTETKKKKKKASSTKKKQLGWIDDDDLEEKQRALLSSSRESSGSDSSRPPSSPSSRSIDRAGAVAVFPSDSSHTTTRRSVNERQISDSDFNASDLNSNRLGVIPDDSLEMIPEPPESQIIDAATTPLTSSDSGVSSSLSGFHSSSRSGHFTSSTHGRNRGSTQATVGTRGSSSMATGPRSLSSMRSSDEELLGSSVQDGTVMARAISSEDYYAEVRRRIQEEAVVAVDVVPIEKENSSSITSLFQDLFQGDDADPRRKRKRFCLIGGVFCCVFIIVLIISVSVALSRREEDDGFDEDEGEYDLVAAPPGDSYQSPEEVMNSGMGVYFRQNFADLLPRESLTEIIGNYESPQYKAFSFIVQNQSYLVNITSMTQELSPKQNSILTTTFVMATLYHSLDGPNWYIKKDWLNPEKPVCEWHGVECPGEILAKEFATAHPKAENAVGELSNRRLLRARVLQAIETKEAFIDDDMNPPEDDTQQSSAFVIDSSSTTAPTSLQENFGDDPPEAQIDLGNNDDENNFGGNPSEAQIDPVVDVPNLAVDVPNSALGPEDDDAYQFFDSTIPIVSLKLNANNLSGSLPDEIGLLTNVYESIDFHYNKISGPIPSNLKLLTNLQSIYLKDNQLSSTLPSDLGLMTAMRTFDISRNAGITGTLPAEFQNWKNIEILKIQGTSLTGVVPSEVCDVINAIDSELYDGGVFKASCSDEFECDCCTHCCVTEGSQERCRFV